MTEEEERELRIAIMQADFLLKTRQAALRHGMGRRGVNRSSTYRSWAHMFTRCTNPKYHAFHHYGGRGISVDPRWRDFANFLADMGECPAGRKLDRIDNDKNYESGNCRWATSDEQTRNRRVTRWVVLYGNRICWGDAAILLGVPRKTMQSWLHDKKISHQETVDHYESRSRR